MSSQGFRKRSGKLALIISLLAGLPVFYANTFQDKWAKLGDRTVNYTVDHSEMVVEGIEKELNAVRVKVKQGAINLHRCVVHYKGGQTQDIDILNSIPAGNESKVIELPSPVKTVSKLVFTYDTKNRAIQKADVEVWGRE
ncbi:MAG TPA: hypothetical protein VD993_07315 [Chitinophagaceae bacterium]|nr:hypothetical protein [Chitinophagaceae bacterium]